MGGQTRAEQPAAFELPGVLERTYVVAVGGNPLRDVSGVPRPGPGLVVSSHKRILSGDCDPACPAIE
jgi:hypothetical protein